jgi:hypothetical protein
MSQVHGKRCSRLLSNYEARESAPKDIAGRFSLVMEFNHRPAQESFY